MKAPAMPGPAALLLLAASWGGAGASRVRVAAGLSDRLSGGVHGLLARLHLEPSSAAPANPEQAAVAVVDFFQANGASAGNATAAPNATAEPQSECMDFLARSVGGLGANWSDADVKAALASACSRGLPALASGSGAAGRPDCPAFAGRLSDARRERLANGTATGFADVCARYAARKPGGGRHAPTEAQQQEANAESEAVGVFGWLIQFVFGVVYYFTVVSKYPTVSADPEAIPEDHPARKLQSMNEVQAVCYGNTTPSNAVLSFCCPAARASHTFHSTDTLNYWCSFFLIMCLPFWGMCCSLFIANSCTPMNKKLGGEERGVFMSLLCTYCCACCVIAQDAESMDLLVGMKTGLCSATKVDAVA